MGERAETAETAAAGRPRFVGGKNIVIKVPRYRFEETVAYDRDVLGLPSLGGEGDSVSFRFGAMRLWLDRVDRQSQTDVWLELFTDDPDAALPTCKGTACRRGTRSNRSATSPATGSPTPPG